jgi:acetyl esterase/lipase
MAGPRPLPSAGAETPDGAVDVASFRLPLSPALSHEAVEAFLASQRRSISALSLLQGPFSSPAEYRSVVDGFRAEMASLHKALVRLERRTYAVDIEETVIGGVRVEVVTPSGGVPEANRHRVLINLHGGAFVGGAEACGLVESVPVSIAMGIEIVCVDYRLAYEHRFPAASEDVAAVFRSLLERHDPAAVGIFGYSAGGLLVAQSLAWFADAGLPRPGAVAMCSAGAGGDGDSHYLATVAMGNPAPASGERPVGWRSGYLGDADPLDPLFSPLHAPEILARFPPSLLLSGTRSFDLSDVVLTHRALLRAGVSAELHVWEGLWHCFPYNPLLPESKEVYELLADFFDRNLRPAGPSLGSEAPR